MVNTKEKVRIGCRLSVYRGLMGVAGDRMRVHTPFHEIQITFAN